MYDMCRLYTVDYNRNIYKRNDATGLASHWLCITDNRGLSRVQRSTKRETITPPTLLLSMAVLYLVSNEATDY